MELRDPDLVVLNSPHSRGKRDSRFLGGYWMKVRCLGWAFWVGWGLRIRGSVDWGIHIRARGVENGQGGPRGSLLECDALSKF